MPVVAVVAAVAAAVVGQVGRQRAQRIHLAVMRLKMAESRRFNCPCTEHRDDVIAIKTAWDTFYKALRKRNCISSE